MFESNEEIKEAYEKEFGERTPSYGTHPDFTVWDAIGATLATSGAVMVAYLVISLIFG